MNKRPYRPMTTRGRTPPCQLWSRRDRISICLRMLQLRSYESIFWRLCRSIDMPSVSCSTQPCWSWVCTWKMIRPPLWYQSVASSNIRATLLDARKRLLCLYQAMSFGKLNRCQAYWTSTLSAVGLAVRLVGSMMHSLIISPSALGGEWKGRRARRHYEHEAFHSF